MASSLLRLARERMDANVESLYNLEENLRRKGRTHEDPLRATAE